MKKTHTGIIILDTIDIVCILFSAGSLLAYGFKRYRRYQKWRLTGEDPIVRELKQKSPINVFSEKGKPLKLPIIRGGAEIRGVVLQLRNRRIAKLLLALLTKARENQKRLKRLQQTLFILHVLLKQSTGFGIAAGGDLTGAQFVLFALPSTLGGFLMEMILDNPAMSALLPLAIVVSRGIEQIEDPREKCRILCKVAENYHNKKLQLEMKNLRPIIEQAAEALNLPLDKVPLSSPLLCTEQPLSLLQRYKLRELIRTEKTRRRVQQFSEFIKQFPECAPDPETVYQEVMKSEMKLPIK